MNRLSKPNTNSNCVQITIDNSVVGRVGRSIYTIYNMHADLGGARTELERNRSALAIFTERERECAQF